MDSFRFLPKKDFAFQSVCRSSQGKLSLKNNVILLNSYFSDIGNSAIEMNETETNFIAFTSSFTNCKSSNGPGAIMFKAKKHYYSFISKLCFDGCEGKSDSIVYNIEFPSESAEMNAVDQISAHRCGKEEEDYNLLLHTEGLIDITLSNVSNCLGRRAVGPTMKTHSSSSLRYSSISSNIACSCFVYFTYSPHGEVHTCSFVDNKQTKITETDYGIISAQLYTNVVVSSCDFKSNTGYLFFRRIASETTMSVTGCYFENCGQMTTGTYIGISNSIKSPNELPFKLIGNDECHLNHSFQSKLSFKILAISIIYIINY